MKIFAPLDLVIFRYTTLS